MVNRTRQRQQPSRHVPRSHSGNCLESAGLHHVCRGPVHFQCHPHLRPYLVMSHQLVAADDCQHPRQFRCYHQRILFLQQKVINITR